MAESAFKAGLEDVVAGESSICYIDGNLGVLSYRGYNIHTLAANATFEETAYLLWFGALPNKQQLADLKLQLAAERKLPDAVVEFLKSSAKNVPMDVLRTAVSMLGLHDADAASMAEPANVRKAIRLTSQIAAIVATFDRLRKGHQPVEADASLSHAAAFLQMLNGEKPGPNAERAMDIALILHADHELNASTFAARVTAATLSDIHSCVVSGIGALKGPLHGGANEAVMKLLLTFSDADAALAGIKKMIAEKQKISGFGHRVYHTEDPRATHLRKMSEKLGEELGDLKWFHISETIEKYIKAEKHLNANVDFYSASTYYALGIPIDLFTPIFAVSRISGWTAHILEQYKNNRLIRPRAEYLGLPDGQPWTPIEEAVSAALKLAVLLVLLAGVSVGVWMQLRDARTRGIPEMSYSRFLREIDGDQVERLNVKGLSVIGYGKDGHAFHVQLPYLDPQLADDIATHAEATFEEDDTTSWDKILLFALPALVLGVSLGLWTNANFSTRPRNPSQPS